VKAEFELDKYSIKDIKEKVLAETYVAILFLLVPLVIAAWLQIRVMGFQPILILVSIGPLFIILIYLFRKRIPYEVSAWALIVLCYIGGIVDIISLGLLSVGLLLFFASCVASAMFLERVQSIVVEIVNSLTFILLGLLIINNVIVMDYDIISFFYSYEAWIAQIIGFALLMLTIVFGIRKIQRFNVAFVEELSGKNQELIANAMQLKAMDDELQVKYDELIVSRSDIENKDTKYRTLFNSLNDFVYLLDLDGRFEAVNETLLDSLAVPEEHILGKTLYDIIPNPENEALWDEIIERVIHTKSKVVQFSKFKDSSGIVHTFEVTLVPIMKDDAVTKIIGTNHDVSELLEKEKTIEHLAYIDPLTDLHNRISFKNFVTNKIKNYTIGTYPFALIFIDLDNFKKINDSIGHANGDVIIKQVAKRIQSTCPNAEIISRMGGDEFAIILTIKDSINDVEGVTADIQSNFADSFKIEGVEYYLSSSIGITIFPYDGSTYEDLLANADSALYEAKRSGRNDYRLFDFNLKQEISLKIQMERHLETALENGEFHVHYQPQYGPDHKIKKFEALMRWNSAEFGQVSPVTFIPLLEETSLIIKYGDWILKEAMKILKHFHTEGFNDLRMAINISPVQFRSPTFVNRVIAALSDVDIDAKYIELEITETVFIEDFENVKRTLNELNDLGIAIALDDFGTGYSSLNYLRTLPIKVLKIDKSFIQSINDKSKDEEIIIGSLIQLAHNLKLEVVAEGIESKDQQDYLDDCGCNLQQGYYHCRPNESQKILEILKAD